jgi:hypothetical protein
VTGRQDDSVARQARTVGEYQREALVDFSNADNLRFLDVNGGALTEPFGVRQEHTQGQWIPNGLVRLTVILAVTPEREAPLGIPKVRGKPLGFQHHPAGHELAPAFEGSAKNPKRVARSP